MPTALSIGPYSLVFFSSDLAEPPHVHVKRERKIAKYWLAPVVLENSRGYAPHELNAIERIVIQQPPFLLEAWHEFFGDTE